MHIGNLGAHRSDALRQMLPSLLNQLSSISSSSTSFSTSASSASTSSSASDNTLTGKFKAQLSDQILSLLTMLQAGTAQNATAVSTSSSASSSSMSVSSTSASPLSTLVSAMDKDGDGAISQSDMESYIEGLGGTQGQADALFSGLNQNGSANLTSAQLASDLQAASASHHHGHHHHGASAEDVGSKLTQAMDTDGDGATSQSELESFVTGLGGTTSEADTIFAALDTQGSAGITTGQWNDAIKSYENSSAPSSTAANPILTLLDNLASHTASSSSSSTASASTSGVTSA